MRPTFDDVQRRLYHCYSKNVGTIFVRHWPSPHGSFPPTGPRLNLTSHHDLPQVETRTQNCFSTAFAMCCALHFNQPANLSIIETLLLLTAPCGSLPVSLARMSWLRRGIFVDVFGLFFISAGPHVMVTHSD